MVPSSSLLRLWPSMLRKRVARTRKGPRGRVWAPTRAGLIQGEQTPVDAHTPPPIVRASIQALPLRTPPPSWLANTVRNALPWGPTLCSLVASTGTGFNPHLPGFKHRFLATTLGATMWFFIFYRARYVSNSLTSLLSRLDLSQKGRCQTAGTLSPPCIRSDR